MAKDSGPRFDPRFDPAFQRGYTPKPGETLRVRKPSVVTPAATDEAPREGAQTVDVAPAEPMAPSATPHRHEPDPLGIERARLAALAQAELAGFVEQKPVELDDESESEAYALPRSNPYVGVLWAIGIVLSLFGFIILVSAVYALVTSSPIDSFDRTMDELGIYSGPVLMTIGLGTMVGLVFLAAVRRYRR